jgi:hypothetical protein
MKRKYNKTFKVVDKETHIELHWRDDVVLIDSEDFWFFEEFKLRIIDGSRRSGHKYLYIVHGVKDYTYETFHRVIMNCPDDMQVDHKNGNTLDNRKSELRICTHSQNMQNAKPHCDKKSSKYKGVILVGSRWTMQIRGKYIKSFDTEIEAAKAYNDYALKYYGRFAKLNEI